MSKGKQIIKDSQLRYKKGLGQNFIYDEGLLKELVRASGVQKEDCVLEIGPGSGTMTAILASVCQKVLALEIDERLLPILHEKLAAHGNVQVVQGDVLQENLVDLTRPLGDSFFVVANIPYYITTPLLTLLLTGGLPIKSLSVMVQKEVADKMLAQPGTEEYGMLSVRCQYFGLPSIAMQVPAACFTPPPKVDSAFVVMPIRKTPPVKVLDETVFFKVANAAFAMRRKTMANNLQSTFSISRQDAEELLRKSGIDGMVRGEKLSLEDFAALANAYVNMQSGK